MDNAHLTEIHADSDYWRAVASTDDSDGRYPPGLTLDLGTTYCRRVLADGESIALHDAAEQGWGDDPAFEENGLRCYHGTPISVDGEPYGTVCFVSESAREEPFSDEETLFAELVARLLEHELQREHTEAKIERLEQFASVLTHDLRNPLAVAKGHVEQVRDTSESEYLATAAEALDRIQTIVEDVLTMARQGHAVEETEEVQLAQIVGACWEAVETAEADLVVEADLRMRAAPDRLRHLFENLFRNAVEHGSTSRRPEADDAVEHGSKSPQQAEDAVEHGGDAVTIRVGALPDDEGFFVEDDGPGIPEAGRDAIFERGHTTGGDGLGLGLAIVDGVVAAHDWQITVTEGTTGGARFEIRDVVVVEPLFT